MSGSQAGATNKASTWPMTRAANSATQLHSSVAAERCAIQAAIIEQARQVAIPVALENSFGIEPALRGEELPDRGMRGFDLRGVREAVIGEEVAAAMAQGQIDEPAKVIGGARHILATVVDVQVEDHAGVVFARPGQRGFVLRFDEPDRAVDEIDAVQAEIAAHVVHE